MKKNYFKNYLDRYSEILIKSDINKLKKIANLINDIKIKKKKVIIIGNGGSASIASHVCVDLTKICKVRSVNFNEANLLTCFSNDYGYAHWAQKALSFYADKGDLLICVSSSGKSMNIINAAKYAKKVGCKIITLTGFSNKNKLKKLGHINLWLDSKNYNFIEMTHQTWLLSVVDFLVKAKF
jgi:D-sedoheptulose 7-phosphate isomerase